MDHLNENSEAIHVSLTATDLCEMNAILSDMVVHGGRMNEEQMKAVDQTT
jgi:hypothetical protein